MNNAFAALTKVYSGYVGMEHFAAAVRLLGYSGVALCLDEMLKIVKLNVSGGAVWCAVLSGCFAVSHARLSSPDAIQLEQTLTPYVAELLAGMPPLIKLPRLDYPILGE